MCCYTHSLTHTHMHVHRHTLTHVFMCTQLNVHFSPLSRWLFCLMSGCTNCSICVDPYRKAPMSPHSESLWKMETLFPQSEVCSRSTVFIPCSQDRSLKLGPAQSPDHACHLQASTCLFFLHSLSLLH